MPTTSAPRRQLLQLIQLVGVACGLAACAPSTSPPPPARAEAPVARVESQATRPARFVSVNIPNLHYVEDEWSFDASDRFRLPTEFEIRDALTAVKQLGADVVRIYALSVKKRSDPPSRIRHVLAPGVLDERAFVALDRVLQVAAELGVRIIVPFVDNWQWWGGVRDYAEFHSLPPDAFWTDERVIADFERTIELVLARTSTLTGRRYRDDPAIYAWETGNELQAPYAWTARIAAYIKAHDRTHALIDGYHSDTVREEAIADPNIDLLTTHHYAPAQDTVSAITRNVERIAGRKPYFVGEFGLLEPEDVRRVLAAVVAQDVLGALIWSLRFHREEGGFYWHAESGPYQAYHWPGFASGDAYGERSVLALLRKASFAARAEVEPRVPPPLSPKLLPIATVTAISWQGSTGATSYDVQRATEPSGHWSELAVGVDDATIPYRALWADATAELGTPYYYRVIARNSAGSSEPSHVVGPVVPTVLTLVDELADRAAAHAFSNAVELTTDEPKRFRMDRTRARATAEAFIEYRAPGPVGQVRAYAFVADPLAGALGIEASPDGVRYAKVPVSTTDYQLRDATEPFHPVLHTATLPAGSRHVRVRLRRGVELGRVELDYRSTAKAR